MHGGGMAVGGRGATCRARTLPADPDQRMRDAAAPYTAMACATAWHAWGAWHARGMVATCRARSQGKFCPDRRTRPACARHAHCQCRHAALPCTAAWHAGHGATSALVAACGPRARIMPTACSVRRRCHARRHGMRGAGSDVQGPCKVCPGAACGPRACMKPTACIVMRQGAAWNARLRRSVPCTGLRGTPGRTSDAHTTPVGAPRLWGVVACKRAGRERCDAHL